MDRFPVCERWIGYREGLKEHGILYDPALAPAWDEKMDAIGTASPGVDAESPGAHSDLHL